MMNGDTEAAGIVASIRLYIYIFLYEKKRLT